MVLHEVDEVTLERFLQWAYQGHYTVYVCSSIFVSLKILNIARLTDLFQTNKHRATCPRLVNSYKDICVCRAFQHPEAQGGRI